MTIREIDQLIEEGESLKQIAQAYSEIANLKIKRIRTAVERNRIFFEEISYVYALIKKLARKKGIVMAKPKKIICLIITSNYRFYGQINSDLIDFFIAQTQKLDTDRIIIGKAAIDYFKANPVFSAKGGSSSGGKNSHQILLKDDQPTSEEINQLVNLLKDYNQVIVFYSKLKSLLIQKPQFSDITASETIEASSQVDFRFIFEPQLPKILQFFDSQILNLLLEQTFLESEVSRTASRFITMDGAETEANKFIKENERLKGRSLRDLDSNKILENFASMMAVSKAENNQP